MSTKPLVQSIEVIHATIHLLGAYYDQFVPKWEGNTLSLVDIKSIPDTIKCENAIIDFWESRKFEIECAFQERLDEGKGPTIVMEHLYCVLERCSLIPYWGMNEIDEFTDENGKVWPRHTKIHKTSNEVQLIMQSIINFYWFSFQGTKYDVEHASDKMKGSNCTYLFFNEERVQARTPDNENTTRIQRKNNDNSTEKEVLPDKFGIELPNWLPKESYMEQVNKGNITEGNLWNSTLSELVEWISKHITKKGENAQWHEANEIFRYRGKGGIIKEATTRDLTVAYYHKNEILR